MNVGDGFLRHYGVLGMKWGIRRYQNPDGTLTPAGRKRYKKALEKVNYKPGGSYESGKSAFLDGFYNPNIIQRNLDFGKTGVIPKGTLAYRTDNYGGPALGSGRKYVSFSPETAEEYADSDVLGDDSRLDDMTDPTYYVYKTSRDLKLASYADVKKYLADTAKHPDRIRQIMADYSHVSVFVDDAKLKKEKSKIVKEAYEWMRDTHSGLTSFYNSKLAQTPTTVGSPVFDHFRALGYDAIEDIEDGGMFNGAAIILDPDKSLVVDAVYDDHGYSDYIDRLWEDRDRTV